MGHEGMSDTTIIELMEKENERLRLDLIAALTKWWEKLDESEREEVRKRWLERFEEDEQFREKVRELLEQQEK
jgi:hypothetical protein